MVIYLMLSNIPGSWTLPRATLLRNSQYSTEMINIYANSFARRKRAHPQFEQVKSNVLHRAWGRVLTSEHTPNFLKTPDVEAIPLPAYKKSKSKKMPQIGVTKGDGFGKLTQVSPTIHSRSSSIASTEGGDAINSNSIAINTMLNHPDNIENSPVSDIDFGRLASPNRPTIQSFLIPALEQPIHAGHEAYGQTISPVNGEAGTTSQNESKYNLATSIQSLLMQSQTRLEAGVHPNIHGTSTSRAKSRERFIPSRQPGGCDRDTLTDPTARFHLVSSATNLPRVTKSKGLSNPTKAITSSQHPTLSEALTLVRWVVEKEKEKEDTRQARLHLATQKELECLKGSKENLVKENDGRQKANAELQARLNDNERRIKEYEEKLEGLKKFSKGLGNDLSAEKSRYKDLQKELAGAIDDGNKLATDRENLRLQIHELEGKIESMQQRITAGQETQAKLTELETEKNQLVAQITEKDIILSTEKSHVSRLEEQLGLVMRNAEPFKNCITDLQETISQQLGKIEAAVVAQNDPEKRDLLRQLLGLVKDVHVRQNAAPDDVDAVRAEIENLHSR